MRISDGMWVPRKETISTLCIYLAFFTLGSSKNMGETGYCMHFFGAILFAFSAVWDEGCLRGDHSRTMDVSGWWERYDRRLTLDG